MLMPRKAKYAGGPRERNRYRQRVHNWSKKGLVEGKDYTIENGVPIRHRTKDGLPPLPGRPTRHPVERPRDAPSDTELVQMTAVKIVKLPYEASVKVALLRRKWDLMDATGNTTSHPIDQLPPLPPHIKEELRDLGDLISAEATRTQPHPYGSRDNGD